MVDRLVIIPTYNEKENIERMVRTVFSLPLEYHVLIIDDGSPDGTAEIVRNLQHSYPESLHLLERSGKLGLGTAYIAGFKWALDKHYEFIFEMDCDFSHNPEDLVRLYHQAMDKPSDVVIGSRYVTGVNVVNWPIGRVLMSYYASVYVRTVLGMPVRDATAGFKCYRRDVLHNINLEKIKFKGYAFQIEMKFKAWQMGYDVSEVPIIFTDRQEGTSKMNTGIFKEAFFGVMEMKLKSIFKPLKRVK